MKIQWFTNIPMPAVARRYGIEIQGSGYWMAALLGEIQKRTDIRISVVTAWPGVSDLYHSEDGVEYFVVGQPNRFSHLRDRRIDLEKCARIVNEWKPDLVHVHGLERFYGLLAARRLINVPTVISIQGMLTSCAHHYFGDLSCWDILRSHTLSDVIRRRGLLIEYSLFKGGARREKEIMMGNKFFMGRTLWDRAHLAGLDEEIRYYHVGELLRDDYRGVCWKLSDCRNNTIIFTNAGSPLRGTETLLAAVRILRKDFPEVRLLIAGRIYKNTGYGRHLMQLITRSGMDSCVEFMGYLDSAAMSRALAEAHVFCIPSYVENSPNSLCEAQMVGIPCVASYTGGIPSLIKERETGLLFPRGDSAVLAQTLRETFLDDELANTLSINARTVASERHDPDTVVGQLLYAYNDILQNTRC